MVAIQRRLNSTERLRITRNHITIKLEEPADFMSFPWASAKIDLSDLKLPLNARVAIDAYFRNSSMRFNCGTVGSLFVPDRMDLTDIDRGGAIRFRLLVIDSIGSGRILASAEGLRPVRDKEGPDRQPLLPLLERDLVGELWRVDVDRRTGPILLVNNSVPGLAGQLRTSPLVQGLILPHALRTVLQELGPPGEDEEDDSWGQGWRRFLAEMGVSIEPDDTDDPQEALTDWIQDAVDAFCGRKDFVGHVRRVLQVSDG